VSIQPYADNFIPVIPVDHQDHTDESPFCWNESCPCHEDQEAINVVAGHVTDGLMTPAEATDFVGGRSI
jgi:hypothetical protein